jgi:hypothetical protein
MLGQLLEIDVWLGRAKILTRAGEIYHARALELEPGLALGQEVVFAAALVGRVRVARRVRKPAPAPPPELDQCGPPGRP